MNSFLSFIIASDENCKRIEVEENLDSLEDRLDILEDAIDRIYDILLNYKKNSSCSLEKIRIAINKCLDIIDEIKED